MCSFTTYNSISYLHETVGLYYGNNRIKKTFPKHMQHHSQWKKIPYLNRLNASKENQFDTNYSGMNALFLRPLVETPLNARAVSNQESFGSVGDKTKGLNVALHGFELILHHVSHKSSSSEITASAPGYNLCSYLLSSASWMLRLEVLVRRSAMKKDYVEKE